MYRNLSTKLNKLIQNQLQKHVLVHVYDLLFLHWHLLLRHGYWNFLLRKGKTLISNWSSNPGTFGYTKQYAKEKAINVYMQCVCTLLYDCAIYIYIQTMIYHSLIINECTTCIKYFTYTAKLSTRLDLCFTWRWYISGICGSNKIVSPMFKKCSSFEVDVLYIDEGLTKQLIERFYFPLLIYLIMNFSDHTQIWFAFVSKYTRLRDP